MEGSGEEETEKIMQKGCVEKDESGVVTFQNLNMLGQQKLAGKQSPKQNQVTSCFPDAERTAKV